MCWRVIKEIVQYETFSVWKLKVDWLVHSVGSGNIEFVIIKDKLLDTVEGTSWTYTVAELVTVWHKPRRLPDFLQTSIGSSIFHLSLSLGKILFISRFVTWDTVF